MFVRIYLLILTNECMINSTVNRRIQLVFNGLLLTVAKFGNMSIMIINAQS